jgi:hypothetical protein
MCFALLCWVDWVGLDCCMYSVVLCCAVLVLRSLYDTCTPLSLIVVDPTSLILILSTTYRLPHTTYPPHLNDSINTVINITTAALKMPGTTKLARRRQSGAALPDLTPNAPIRAIVPGSLPWHWHPAPALTLVQ